MVLLVVDKGIGGEEVEAWFKTANDQNGLVVWWNKSKLSACHRSCKNILGSW